MSYENKYTLFTSDSWKRVVPVILPLDRILAEFLKTKRIHSFYQIPTPTANNESVKRIKKKTRQEESCVW